MAGGFVVWAFTTWANNNVLIRNSLEFILICLGLCGPLRPQFENTNLGEKNRGEFFALVPFLDKQGVRMKALPMTGLLIICSIDDQCYNAPV